MHLPAPESLRAFWLLAPIIDITAHLFWDLLPICTISVSELTLEVFTWLEECLTTSLQKAFPLKISGTHSMSWKGQLSFLVRLAQVQPPPPSASHDWRWLSTLSCIHYQTQFHGFWCGILLKSCLWYLYHPYYPNCGHCAWKMLYGDGLCGSPDWAWLGCFLLW